MIQIALFASGSGSNAERITKYFCSHHKIMPAVIFTNNPDAFVIERAKHLGLPCVVVGKAQLNDEQFFKNLLASYNIDFIVLAGFLLQIPAYLVEAFPQRIVNIHPALLPKYGGKGMYGNYVHEAVIANNEKESGISIHYVNENYDEGAILFQAKTYVGEGDTAETLAERIHALEYAYFPKVIEDVINKLFA